MNRNSKNLTFDSFSKTLNNSSSKSFLHNNNIINNEINKYNYHLKKNKSNSLTSTVIYNSNEVPKYVLSDKFFFNTDSTNTVFIPRKKSIANENISNFNTFDEIKNTQKMQSKNLIKYKKQYSDNEYNINTNEIEVNLIGSIESSNCDNDSIIKKDFNNENNEFLIDLNNNVLDKEFNLEENLNSKVGVNSCKNIIEIKENNDHIKNHKYSVVVNNTNKNKITKELNDKNPTLPKNNFFKMLKSAKISNNKTNINNKNNLDYMYKHFKNSLKKLYFPDLLNVNLNAKIPKDIFYKLNSLIFKDLEVIKLEDNMQLISGRSYNNTFNHIKNIETFKEFNIKVFYCVAWAFCFYMLIIVIAYLQ